MLSQISYANTLPCKNFCFHGHPINPACVDAIIGDLGGGTDRVNLTRCEVKNHHNGFTATLDGSQQKGYYSVITCDASKPKSTCTNDAYGAYKVIAKTPNDTFVINTYYSGGGTGDFNQLDLFKIMYGPHDQVYLVAIAGLAGGDRGMGSVMAGSVSMKGSHVMGLRESAKNTTAIAEYPPEKFDFDLSKVSVMND